MIVGIDPGHGGTNKGCTGSGLHEEELTLRTAMAVRQAMFLRDGTTRVVLSRETDETVSLTERARRLRECDFVLCLHYDHGPEAGDSPVGALGCYCFEDDAIARAAGERIERQAPLNIAPKAAKCTFVDPKTWTAHAFNCLTQHRPRPALLVEVAFLSNPAHCAYLKGPDAMAEISQVLCDGIGEGLLGVARRVAGPAVV